MNINPIMASALSPITPRPVDWAVVVEFSKGPAFSCTASAPYRDQAVTQATRLAAKCGYDAQVKSVKARRVDGNFE